MLLRDSGLIWAAWCVDADDEPEQVWDEEAEEGVGELVGSRLEFEMKSRRPIYPSRGSKGLHVLTFQRRRDAPYRRQHIRACPNSRQRTALIKIMPCQSPASPNIYTKLPQNQNPPPHMVTRRSSNRRPPSSHSVSFCPVSHQPNRGCQCQAHQITILVPWTCMHPVCRQRSSLAGSPSPLASPSR